MVGIYDYRLGTCLDRWYHEVRDSARKDIHCGCEEVEEEAAFVEGGACSCGGEGACEAEGSCGFACCCFWSCELEEEEEGAMRLRIREVLVRKDDVGGVSEFEVPYGWKLDQIIDFNAINFKLILTDEVDSVGADEDCAVVDRAGDVVWMKEGESPVDAIRREEEERFALT